MQKRDSHIGLSLFCSVMRVKEFKRGESVCLSNELCHELETILLIYSLLFCDRHHISTFTRLARGRIPFCNFILLHENNLSYPVLYSKKRYPFFRVSLFAMLDFEFRKKG